MNPKTKVLQFVVVVLFALALAPVFGQLLALPIKIELPEQEYFTTQASYLGWTFPTGTVPISAIVASLVLAIVMRARARRSGFRGSVCLDHRHDRGVLHLDAACESGHGKLDHRPQELARVAQQVGVLPRRERDHHLPCVVRGGGIDFDRTSAHAR